MSDIRNDILNASVQVFMRYGVGRTRMGDIASEAGVVRQTLYSFFKNKDEILCAAIEHFGALSLLEIQKGWEAARTLGEKLDIYFEHSVLNSFDVISASVDARDMIGGYNEAGRAATRRTQAEKIAALTDVLEPCFKGGDADANESKELAEYIVLASLGARDLAQEKQQLERMLVQLKKGVLAQLQD